MKSILLKLAIVPGIFILILQNGLLAQQHEHDHNHHHGHHHHEHPSNEIGAGNYISYLVGENEFAYGLHVHYLRSLKESRFGAGIGYEHIFDEHSHRFLGLIGTYRPLESLIFSLAPGMLFANLEEQTTRFALHAEVIYEIEISNFHLGPALEFATSFEEIHLGIGLHLALAF